MGTTTRRNLIASGGASLLLGACGEGRVLRGFVDTAGVALSGGPKQEIPRDAISATPYGQIAARLGQGPWAHLVLYAYDGDNLQWVSQDRTMIVTRFGRAVRTVGLRKTREHTNFQTLDPIAAAPLGIDGPQFCRRIEQYAGEDVFSALIGAKIEPIDQETISISGLEFKTVVLRETCEARYLNWRFENRFWVDVDNGFVWKSRQHIARDFPILETEVLKPAA